jgi:hypothetical protein
VGGTYLAKVSDRVVPIHIDRENPRGGWVATNQVTNKQVRIKSAQRLRGPAPRKDDSAAKAVDAVTKGNLADGVKVPTATAKKKLTKKQQEALGAQAKADQENARLRDERAKSKDSMTASERAMATSKKKTKADKPKKKREGMSGLDAVAQVLKNAGKPMRCKELVETAIAKGLWKTGGKTPAATIYAAILREIQQKGKDSRFQKVERGLFTLTSAAKKGA